MVLGAQNNQGRRGQFAFCHEVWKSPSKERQEGGQADGRTGPEEGIPGIGNSLCEAQGAPSMLEEGGGGGGQSMLEEGCLQKGSWGGPS